MRTISPEREYDDLLTKMEVDGPAAFSNFVANAYKMHRIHCLLYPATAEERQASNFDYFCEFARRCGVNVSWLAQIMLGSWHKPDLEVVQTIGSGIGCCADQLHRLQELVSRLECERRPTVSQVVGIYWDKDLEREIAERASAAVSWQVNANRPKTGRKQQKRSRRHNSDAATSNTGEATTVSSQASQRKPWSDDFKQRVSKTQSANWAYVKAVRTAIIEVVNQEAPTSRLMGNADPAKVIDRRISEIARRSGVDVEIINNLWEGKPRLMRRRLLDAIRKGLHDFLPAESLRELNQLAEQR